MDYWYSENTISLATERETILELSVCVIVIIAINQNKKMLNQEIRSYICAFVVSEQSFHDAFD